MIRRRLVALFMLGTLALGVGAGHLLGRDAAADEEKGSEDILQLLQRFNGILTLVKYNYVDELESEADRMEADIIGRLFCSEMDGMDKLLLRDLVQHISGISDRAENVGDRLRIIVAKRSL